MDMLSAPLRPRKWKASLRWRWKRRSISIGPVNVRRLARFLK